MRFFLNIPRYFFCYIPARILSKKANCGVRIATAVKSSTIVEAVDSSFNDGGRWLLFRDYSIIVIETTDGVEFGSARFYPPIKGAIIYVGTSPKEAVLRTRLDLALYELSKKTGRD
jgi:hypothetical protein